MVRVCVDLFEYCEHRYLVAFGAFFNFSEVEQLTDTTTVAMVEVVSAIFARHGLLMEVCTENGPQFSSNKIKTFALRYDFQQVPSSANFPRSNGLAEKGVQIVKG